MKFLTFIAACLFTLPALAEETIEDIDPITFSKTSEHSKEQYMEYRTGDHFEWTLYGEDYSKPNFGHRYEWSKTGLSVMSICVAVDGQTGGEKYRRAVEDEYCPKYDAEYVWNVAYAGQPSRCLKVDSLTQGGRFSRIVDDARCAKPFTVFVWEKKTKSAQPECFEFDGETNGLKYRRSAPDYLCAKKLDVDVAFGRKEPNIGRGAKAASRAPASIEPYIQDKTYWEDPEDLVEHVHRSADKIHRR